ncbi:uncharacterized protein LOC144953586 [Lampetra fluviatilis]
MRTRPSPPAQAHLMHKPMTCIRGLIRPSRQQKVADRPTGDPSEITTSGTGQPRAKTGRPSSATTVAFWAMWRPAAGSPDAGLQDLRRLGHHRILGIPRCLGNETRHGRPSGNKLAREISDPGHKRNSGLAIPNSRASSLAPQHQQSLLEREGCLGFPSLPLEKSHVGVACTVVLGHATCLARDRGGSGSSLANSPPLSRQSAAALSLPMGFVTGVPGLVEG